MFKLKRVISVLIVPVLFVTTSLISTGPFKEVAYAAATPLKCETASTWTDLFKRTSGWLGADGIFSIPLDGKDQIGSATSTTKTFFTFCDTNLGTVDPATFVFQPGWTGANNTAAMLTGNTPTAANISFKYGNNGDMTYTNLYPGRVWPGDGIAINNTIHLIAQRVDEGMNPLGVDRISIPVVNGNPDFANKTITNNLPLMYREPGIVEITYGAGIFDNSATAGAPNPDGYVYIYGYRNILAQSLKKLVVARVLRTEFSDMSKWRFYNNGIWETSILAVNNDWACIADHVAPEISVTYINSGIYNGKYMLVYEKDTISNNLVYRIGDSPVGPFGEEIQFYTVPEPGIYQSSYPNNAVVTYNAKAHPHLSSAGELLISYNVNVWGAFPTTSEIYRPRFVKLKLNEYAAAPPTRPAQTNVARGKTATASHDSSQAGKAVDGISNTTANQWTGSGMGDKWLRVDLGSNMTITRWVVRNASAAGQATAYNTQDFKLQRSTDGSTWYDVDSVTYNTAPVVDRDVTAFTARYVRLYITKASQGTDTTARIPEFEVYKNN